MNRRTFLHSTTAALAASAFKAEAQDPTSKEPKPLALKKAVNLNMVKLDGSPVDKFRAVKDAGFDGLELNRPDALPLEDLLAARDATGLAIAGVICTTHWNKPLTHNDPAIREQGMRGLKLAIEETAALGCQRLLLVPGVVNKATPYDVAYTRSLAAIKEAAPFAEKAGIKIAVENVWNQFLLSPLEAARFIDEIGSPAVGWHFDIGNVITYGWPEHWIRILGPRILNLHIKEFSRTKRDKEGLWKGFAVELGEGDNDWPAIVLALKEITYTGWAILEVPSGDATRLKFLAERTERLLS